MGVLEEPHVDTDAPVGLFERFSWFTVQFGAERGDPLARRLFPDRDLLGCRVVGDGAAEPDRDVSEFRGRGDGPTAPFCSAGAPRARERRSRFYDASDPAFPQYRYDAYRRIGMPISCVSIGIGTNRTATPTNPIASVLVSGRSLTAGRGGADG